MAKKIRMFAAVCLVCAMCACMLTGCIVAVPRNLKLEPFDMDWGITVSEAEEKLKCVYLTNSRSTDILCVMGADNENLEAFGTTPSVILYNFNLTDASSDTPRLGEVLIRFPEEDYDSVLAYLNKVCRKGCFDDPQWGTKDADVYLFDNIISIQYSSTPMENPIMIPKENRDRYIIMAGLRYDSQKEMAKLNIQRLGYLWAYSTAETDFTRVDNRK